MLKNILIVDNQIEDCQEIESKIKAVYSTVNIKVVNDGVQVLNSLEYCIPDFIIMDLDMPNLNGLDTTKIIVDNHPNIHIIIISSKKTEGELLQMVNLGAKGFIEKRCSSQTYWTAIETINKGKLFFSDAILKRYVPRKKQEINNNNEVGIVIENSNNDSIKTTPEDYFINEDELLVLKYICEDLHNAEIATKICKHIRGVEYKITHLFKLTSTTNRHQLKEFAIKNGWHKDGTFDSLT